MKAVFWVTFTAEVKGDQVKAVKATTLTQGPPNARAAGMPIKFEVEVPDEYFLDRRVSVAIDLAAPGAGDPPEVRTDTAWARAKAAHGA